MLKVRFGGMVKPEIPDSPTSPDQEPLVQDSPASPDQESIIPDSPASPDPRPSTSYSESSVAPGQRAPGSSFTNTVTVTRASLMQQVHPPMRPLYTMKCASAQPTCGLGLSPLAHPAPPQPPVRAQVSPLVHPAAPQLPVAAQGPPVVRPPPVQPCVLGPLRPLGGIELLDQLRPFYQRLYRARYYQTPQQGIAPYNVPTRPRNMDEAEQLQRAANGQLNRRRILIQRTSHMHIAYFRSRETSDWRCVECYHHIPEDWEFVYLHCVGQNVSLRTPHCPGPCQKNPFILEKLHRCSACSLVFFSHEADISEGQVFKHP